MEKRVYDEEVVEKKEESTAHTEPAGSIDFVPKIKEALKEGLPIIKSQVSNFEDQINGHPSRTLDRTTNNNYSFRLLPYILGTEEFIDSPTVGVAERYQPRPESIPSLQKAGLPLTSTQSSPSLRSNLQVPVHVDDIASDSEVSSISEAGGGIPVIETREIEETTNKKPGFNHLQDELAARLRGSSSAHGKPALSPGIKTFVRTESQEDKPIHSSHIAAPTQASAEAVAREIFQPPKKRNLFDDSSSDSEGELFKPNAPNVTTTTSSVFNPPMPKLVTTPPLKPQLIGGKTTDSVTKNKGSNLFGSSDSEDDLFSGITSTVAAKQVAKSRPVNNLSDEEENIFSSKNKMSNPKSESQITAPVAVAKVNNKQQSLFEDEDVPDFIDRKPNPPTSNIEEAVQKPEKKPFAAKSPVVQTNPTVSVLPKQKNLFADSDSDEDLFHNILAKNKEPVAELNKPSSTSPLPESFASHSNPYQSTPIQNGDKKEEQKEKRLAPYSDGNDIPVQVEQKPKVKASLFFDDDSDDEDLFGRITSAKRPLLSSNVDDAKILLDGDLFNTPSANESVTQAKVVVAAPSEEGDLFSEKTKSTTVSNVPSVARKPEQVVGTTKEIQIPVTNPPEPPQKKEANMNGLNKHAPSIEAEPIVSTLPKVTPPTAISKNLPTTLDQQHRQMSALDAFEDSDDEDLFGGSSKRPLPSITPPVPVKLSTGPKTGVKEIEDENLFRDAIEKKQTPPPIVLVKESTATEKVKEMQDGEDIFSGSIGREKSPTPVSSLDPKVIEKVEISNGERKINLLPETEDNPQPVEQTTASRIASLKLSLAKQPGLVASESADGENTTSNSVRKPFGGVPLFGPRIPSPVKSNPPSPIKTHQKIAPQDTTGSANEDSGQSNDLLDCLGKQRPKAPNCRRPPSRVFRRSQILDNEIGTEAVIKCVKYSSLTFVYIGLIYLLGWRGSSTFKQYPFNKRNHRPSDNPCC